MTREEQIEKEMELHRLMIGWDPFETEDQLEARIEELHAELEHNPGHLLNDGSWKSFPPSRRARLYNLLASQVPNLFTASSAVAIATNALRGQAKTRSGSTFYKRTLSNRKILAGGPDFSEAGVWARPRPVIGSIPNSACGSRPG